MTLSKSGEPIHVPNTSIIGGTTIVFNFQKATIKYDYITPKSLSLSKTIKNNEDGVAGKVKDTKPANPGDNIDSYTKQLRNNQQWRHGNLKMYDISN